MNFKTNLVCVIALIAMASCLIPVQAQLRFSTIDEPVYYQMVFTRDNNAIEDRGVGANLGSVEN